MAMFREGKICNFLQLTNIKMIPGFNDLLRKLDKLEMGVEQGWVVLIDSSKHSSEIE